jgi:hypothetical protein
MVRVSGSRECDTRCDVATKGTPSHRGGFRFGDSEIHPEVDDSEYLKTKAETRQTDLCLPFHKEEKGVRIVYLRAVEAQ